MDMTPGDDAGATVKTLTPAEVHNVAFKKPPIGKRGYDEEEVDNFLDVVETELSRLIEANVEPKAHAGGGPVDEAALAAATDQAIADENRRLSAALSKIEQDHQHAQDEAHAAAQRAQQAEAQAQEAQQALVQAQEKGRAAGSAGAPSADHHQQAVRVLALAQQTADQHLDEAKAEAERLVSGAQHQAQTLTEDSSAAAERRVSEAQARADALQRESQAKATQTVQDAEQRAGAISDALEGRKAALETRVDELKIFEREYRSRLTSYLESQLRDLEHGGRDDEPATDQRVESGQRS